MIPIGEQERSAPILSIDEEKKVRRMSTVVLADGLNCLLEEKAGALMAKPELTQEDVWMCEVYAAIGSLISHNDHPEYVVEGTDRKTAMQARRYMMFVGFYDQELSADGITKASERFWKQVEEAGKIGDDRDRDLDKTKEVAGSAQVDQQMYQDLMYYEEDSDRILKMLKTWMRSGMSKLPSYADIEGTDFSITLVSPEDNTS